MTLPLFDPPPVPTHRSSPAVTTPSSEVSTRIAAAIPLSIREVAGLIHERLRPLTAHGRRIVHAQWIRPSLNAGARGFLSVTLADTQDNAVAIDGFIWERADVQSILKQGHSFGCNLLDREGRCEVMLEVTIDFWAKKTKPYLRIHGLNQVGMKGLRQQQREATLKRLEEEALLDRNKTRPLARPALRVLCIAKQDSDGCRDAIAILSRSGYRFQWTVHHVAVQGVAAVPTLIEAFTQLATRLDAFDVVLLIRGGGSELDLLAYDEYAVAQAVALCKLPVVTGLGHTADHSVCDSVSYKALETPTAAARFLVETVEGIHAQLQGLRDQVRTASLQQLHQRQRHLLAQRPQFLRTALSLVQTHQRQRAAGWHTLARGVQDLLHACQSRLRARYQPIGSDARRLLQRHRTCITADFRTVVTGAPSVIATRRHHLQMWRHGLPLTALTTVVAPAQRDLRALRQQLHHVSCETVRRAHTLLHRLHAHIRAASPERLFALGFSYVTRPDGTAVRRRADVTPGDLIDIHLIDGAVPAIISRKDHHA